MRAPRRLQEARSEPILVGSDPGYPAPGLLTEVAKVQHDKTLLLARDAIERISIRKQQGRSEWDTTDRTAAEFKADVLAVLRTLEGP